MSNVRDFLMSSDHQMDKIIYFKERLIPVSSKQGSITFSAELPFCPLVFGVWSTTPDFTVCQPFIQGGIMSARTMDFVIDSVSMHATSLNGVPTIMLSNYFTSVHDYYVRIYGFMPTDKELPANITSDQAKNLILSSDFNYRKLAMAGVLPYTIDMTTGQSSTVTINHGLGYLPQVMAWLEFEHSSSPGEIDIIPFEFSQRGTPPVPRGEIILTDESAFITPVSGQWGDTFKVHYRIYYDEA